MKHVFITASMLVYFNSNREVLVEANASDYVSAGILSQRNEKEVLYSVVFFLKKHSLAEYNYEIYNKELIAIVRYFEEWHAKLEESSYIIEVLLDYKNLEYFITTKLLFRR